MRPIRPMQPMELMRSTERWSRSDDVENGAVEADRAPMR